MLNRLDLKSDSTFFPSPTGFRFSNSSSSLYDSTDIQLTDMKTSTEHSSISRGPRNFTPAPFGFDIHKHMLPAEVLQFAPTRDSAAFTLIVNVPFSTSREDLNRVFGEYGEVELAMVVCSAESRHPHREWTSTAGYAFVKFRRTADAMKALYASSLGQIVIKGSCARADWARKDSYAKNEPATHFKKSAKTQTPHSSGRVNSGAFVSPLNQFVPHPQQANRLTSPIDQYNAIADSRMIHLMNQAYMQQKSLDEKMNRDLYIKRSSETSMRRDNTNQRNTFMNHPRCGEIPSCYHSQWESHLCHSRECFNHDSCQNQQVDYFRSLQGMRENVASALQDIAIASEREKLRAQLMANHYLIHRSFPESFYKNKNTDSHLDNQIVDHPQLNNVKSNLTSETLKLIAKTESLLLNSTDKDFDINIYSSDGINTDLVNGLFSSITRTPSSSGSSEEIAFSSVSLRETPLNSTNLYSSKSPAKSHRDNQDSQNISLPIKNRRCGQPSSSGTVTDFLQNDHPSILMQSDYLPLEETDGRYLNLKGAEFDLTFPFDTFNTLNSMPTPKKNDVKAIDSSLDTSCSSPTSRSDLFAEHIQTPSCFNSDIRLFF